MKVSKQLLQSILIGVSIGTVATISSCSIADTVVINELEAEKCDPDTETKNEHNWEDCPACGMG